MLYGQVKVSSGKTAVSSAVGILSFLEEPEKKLRIFALEKIYDVIDLYWPEIAESLVEIEKLYEDEDFSHRELAAIIASKIYFHLEAYADALKYALGAGKLFNILEKSQYTHTILAKCIDEYIERRNELYEFELKNENNDKKDSDGMEIEPPSPIDVRLEMIVERMLCNCIKEGDEKQALGISFDSKRLDFIENIIVDSKNPLNLLHYCLKNAQQLIPTKKFRNDVLNLVAKMHQKLDAKNFDDYPTLCLCLYHQGDVNGVAENLYKLLKKEDDEFLLAYQIAFDIVDLENQSFLTSLLQNPVLRTNRMKKQSSADGELADVFDEDEDDGSITNVLNNNNNNNNANENSSFINENLIGATNNNEETNVVKNTKEEKAIEETKVENTSESHSLDFPSASNSSCNEKVKEDEKVKKENIEDDLDVKKDLDEDVMSCKEFKREIKKEQLNDEKLDQKLILLRRVLIGNASIELNLQFLHRNNHSDLILLNDIKNSVDQRNGITHNAIIIAHGFMQAGTSCDVFLRNNLDWLAKAVNWAKFSATASVGVIHKGQTKDSKKVLSTYLPAGTANNSSSPYSEGGALYALGLIHANHMNKKIKDYLLSQLRAASNDETLQHGACLGIGLLCLGTNDDQLYEELKSVMFMDSAVVGEAAAYAIGLVMLASASQKVISELLAYAHDTQHEKIIRACSVAMSMVMYRKEEEADALIDQLSLDKDALVRYGAMYTIAMAYCGTSKNSALRRLLHVSVSDVSDDVRRAAVIALGFVLCNSPEQVPKILNLLSESYNAHVRYAAALAVGISCAGRGLIDAINLLIQMTSDSTDFVRQGALIGLGLVLQQVTEGMNEKVKKVRELIVKVISDKHEDVMTRFGAILAAGLIDAGGRNATATFFSRSGYLRREAAVGFCLFSQLWYWYPLIHCISLAFLPSALIGVNKDLKIPIDFKVKCSAPFELFAYPPPTPKEKKEEKKETVTAILSTTAKRQAMKITPRIIKVDSAPANTPRKLVEDEDGDIEMKSVEKPIDSVETSSVVSDGRTLNRLEVSSVAATAGEQSSSRVSHDGSIVGNTSEIDSSNANTSNTPITELTDNNNNSTQLSQIINSNLTMDVIDNAKDLKQVEDISVKTETDRKETNVTQNNKIKQLNENSSFQYELRNPCRVLLQQEKYIEFYNTNCRYVPVSNNRKSGFVLLRDTRPAEREAILATEDHKIVIRSDNSNLRERDPPEAFEWSG